MGMGFCFGGGHCVYGWNTRCRAMSTVFLTGVNISESTFCTSLFWQKEELSEQRILGEEHQHFEPQPSCMKMQKITFTFQGVEKIRVHRNRRYMEINDLFSKWLFYLIIINRQKATAQEHPRNCMGRAEVCCHGSIPASRILTTREPSTISSSPDGGSSHLIYTLFAGNKWVLNKW